MPKILASQKIPKFCLSIIGLYAFHNFYLHKFENKIPVVGFCEEQFNYPELVNEKYIALTSEEYHFTRVFGTKCCSLYINHPKIKGQLTAYKNVRIKNSHYEEWPLVQFEFLFDKKQLINDAHFVQFAQFTGTDFQGNQLKNLYFETSDIFSKIDSWGLDVANTFPFSIYYDTYSSHNRTSKEISIFDSPSFGVYSSYIPGIMYNGSMKFKTYLVIHNIPVACISWKYQTNRYGNENLSWDYEDFNIKKVKDFEEFGKKYWHFGYSTAQKNEKGEIIEVSNPQIFSVNDFLTPRSEKFQLQILIDLLKKQLESASEYFRF